MTHLSPALNKLDNKKKILKSGMRGLQGSRQDLEVVCCSPCIVISACRYEISLTTHKQASKSSKLLFHDTS